MKPLRSLRHSALWGYNGNCDTRNDRLERFRNQRNSNTEHLKYFIQCKKIFFLFITKDILLQLDKKAGKKAKISSLIQLKRAACLNSFFLKSSWCNVCCQIVGEEVSKNDATDAQDENQLVRPRRSVVSKTILDCYKQFVAGNQPPSGFRQNHTNIRYICQQVPRDPVIYYSTMFDLNYGIPVYSAYVVFQEQASQFGNVNRTGREKWRQEPGKLSVWSL